MQVIFSGGVGTFLPVVFGFLSGMMSVNLCKVELPDVVYSICSGLGKVFVDEAPAVMMARSVQRAGRSRPSRRDGGQRTAVPPAAAAATQPPQPPSPPPEEAIEQLTSMGFEREAVIRALQMSGNNVEAAANRLLMSG